MSDQSSSAGPGVNRRTVLRGIAFTGAAGVSAPLLAACGGSNDGNGSAGGGGNSGAGGDNGGGGADGLTVPVSDVPVEGGTIIKDQIVVTQPTEGEFAAFSAICTHAGCPVASVSGGTINCDCHGSKYAIADASVVRGPATQPLEKKSVSVEGDQLVIS